MNAVAEFVTQWVILGFCFLVGGPNYNGRLVGEWQATEGPRVGRLIIFQSSGIVTFSEPMGGFGKCRYQFDGVKLKLFGNAGTFQEEAITELTDTGFVLTDSNKTVWRFKKRN